MTPWMDHIRDAIDLAGRSGVAEINFRDGAISIHLSRSVSATALPPTVNHAPLPVGQSAILPVAPLPDAPAPAQESARSSEHIITAPAYGIFHQRPTPTAPAFVKVGDKVEKGQQIGLMESMKVFSAIEADASGIVMELLTTDGEEMDAGTPLLRLQ